MWNVKCDAGKYYELEQRIEEKKSFDIPMTITTRPWLILESDRANWEQVDTVLFEIENIKALSIYTRLVCLFNK